MWDHPITKALSRKAHGNTRRFQTKAEAIGGEEIVVVIKFKCS